MTKRLVERVVVTLLVCATTVDAGLFALVLIEKRGLECAPAILRPGMGSGPLPPAEGFASDGARTDAADRIGGWAIRYASGRCRFCREDEQWNILATRLQGRGVRVLVVLPTASAELPREALVPRAAPQAAYVSVEWAKRFRLTLTPTVLIFDDNRRLIWHREGMLTSKDPESAVSAVDAARARR